MSAHAVLSPSSAERWIQCPASVRMAKALPRPPESPYALEGTIAHALAELEARLAFGAITPAQHTRARNAWRERWDVDEATEEEMSTHVAGYVALLLDRAAQHPDTQLLVEQRLPTGVPSCWGTTDAALASPVHIEIVDFKYGAGVRVDAEGNPQLRLYGIGALEQLGDLLGDPETVTMTVYQPRIGDDGHVSSETLSADDLRAWRDSLIPIAEQALGDDAPFGPSEAACRWCPAAGQCRAQMEWATAVDFGTEPDALTPADLADALERIPALVQWAEAVKNVALDLAYNQSTPVPGYKVVRSGGRRVITDQEAALDALAQVGYSLDDVSARKLKGIGELEKFLGKADFATVLEDFITKTEGSPALVPDADKRPAIDHNAEAIKEFS